MAKNGLLRRRSRAGDWFRMGIFSATVLAPLIARWNDLRKASVAKRATDIGKDLGALADEQTRDLRHLAAERARELSELAAGRSQEWADLARARSDEWRDLAADRASEWSGIATDRARELGDQALALSDDLLALAAGRAGNLRKQAVARLEDARQQFLATKTYDTLKDTVPLIAKLDNRKTRRGTTIWVIGATLGLLAAGIAGYVLLRRRLGVAPEEPLVELPRTGANGVGASARPPAAMAPGALSGLRAAAQRQGAESMSDTSGAQGTKVAPIVGNIHTKVYHDATDVNLPSEENRIYFASEDAARVAGYRPGQPTAIERVERNESRSPRP